MESDVKKAISEMRLQPEENFVLKVMQFEELLTVRHSVFIIGAAGTGNFENNLIYFSNFSFNKGKTQIWKTLNHTYSSIQNTKTTVVDLDPKVVSNDELYGYISENTREWKDGLFSMIIRDMVELEHAGPKWMILDGDIDPMWIESLNSLMDDNKILTLANNERIQLKPTMKLIFEISHLKCATPATVSRAGIKLKL